jgi:anti-sigma regulatory factor (Ser/Thr protein kinase)
MQLTIPPSPAHLAGLRRLTRASLRGVSSEVAEEIVLAVNEAATNAILYGSGAGQPVEVAVAVKADWVEATVLDHGPALPPSSLLAGGDTEALSAHGRGLWLLRRLVDEVRLERVRRGTRVTLRRRVRSPRALATERGAVGPPAPGWSGSRADRRRRRHVRGCHLGVRDHDPGSIAEQKVAVCRPCCWAGAGRCISVAALARCPQGRARTRSSARPRPPEPPSGTPGFAAA